jgi:hypothetical protein
MNTNSNYEKLLKATISAIDELALDTNVFNVEGHIDAHEAFLDIIAVFQTLNSNCHDDYIVKCQIATVFIDESQITLTITQDSSFKGTYKEPDEHFVEHLQAAIAFLRPVKRENCPELDLL